MKEEMGFRPGFDGGQALASLERAMSAPGFDPTGDEE
jgi:hypothetical protein